VAPKTKFEAPNLENATPEMLIDEMGKLSVVEGYVKKLRAYYKEAYYARKEITPEKLASGEAIAGVGGDLFDCTTSRSDPNRFDQTAFGRDYPALVEQYKTSKPQLTTRFTLKEGVANPLVEDLLTQMKRELDLE
jgi:hypothetical protein